MDLKTLLYVSESRLSLPDQAEEVGAIVEVARRRNGALAVTGALIFTEASFAQFLEGPPAAVDELMASIRRDPRHARVTIALEAPSAGRRFADWTMAYSGPSLYVERHVRPLFDVAPGAVAARQRLCGKLVYLMEELSRQPGAAAAS